MVQQAPQPPLQVQQVYLKVQVLQAQMVPQVQTVMLAPQAYLELQEFRAQTVQVEQMVLQAQLV
jgi:hypothetical protein